jgi:hypothetical protein
MRLHTPGRVPQDKLLLNARMQFRYITGELSLSPSRRNTVMTQCSTITAGALGYSRIRRGFM